MEREIVGKLSVRADTGRMHVGAGRIAGIAEFGLRAAALLGPARARGHGAPVQPGARRAGAERKHGLEASLGRQKRSLPWRGRLVREVLYEIEQGSRWFRHPRSN